MAAFHARDERVVPRLLQGTGHVTETGEPTAYWPIGYPYFLFLVYSLFGKSLAAAKIFNLLLSLATVALTYALARRCCGEKTGKAAAIIIALLPSQIFYSNFLASENLFTPLLLLSLYLAVRFDRRPAFLFAAGAVAATAALVRPPGLILPGVFLCYYLLKREKPSGIVLRLAAVLLGMIAVLSPWMVRNYRAFGKTGLVSTRGGPTFYIGNNEHATGTYDIASVWNIPGKTELEMDRQGYREGLRFIISNPGRFTILGIQKMYYMYGNELLAMDWSFYSIKNRNPLRVVATYISQALYLLFMAAAIAGIRIWLGSREKSPLLPFLAIIAWTLIHIAYFGSDRFHFPVTPMLAIFAARGAFLAFRLEE